MKNLFIISLIFILIGNFISCTGLKNSCNQKQTLHYSIILGSGGGFTGAYEGKMIDTAGIIYKWEGRTFLTSHKQEVGALSQSQISKLNDFLNENNFQDYSKEVGNMTTFLTLSSPNGDKTFSWKETEIPDRVPDKIRELYFLINSALTSKK